MVETTMSGSKYILCRLDNELKVMEEKHAVSARWLPNAKRYEECERTLLFSKSEQLLLHVWKASQRRAFLLDLKRKYAGTSIYQFHNDKFDV